jgi:hypothetical protein
MGQKITDAFGHQQSTTHMASGRNVNESSDSQAADIAFGRGMGKCLVFGWISMVPEYKGAS